MSAKLPPLRPPNAPRQTGSFDPRWSATDKKLTVEVLSNSLNEKSRTEKYENLKARLETEKRLSAAERLISSLAEEVRELKSSISGLLVFLQIGIDDDDDTHEQPYGTLETSVSSISLLQNSD